MSQFQTFKSDLTHSRIVDTDSVSIHDGEIAVKIESFAFTANNVTYGVAGDTIGYWKFFQQRKMKRMNGAASLCGGLLKLPTQILRV